MGDEWEKKIARLAVQYLASLEVTEAHSALHLRKVAELTQKIGEIYGLTQREKELAYAAGWFHDIIRSPSGPGVGDEGTSAKETRRILEGAGLITREEGAAITYAIEKHGHYPKWLTDPETREKFPEALAEKVRFVLFVADKMEQNGVRAIARRCSFAAGDRLRDEKGDWRTFEFEPDKDEGLVVAITSVYRLALINPEEIYPLRLHSLVHPLYEVQREFVRGVLRGFDLKIKDIVHLLLEKKDEKGRNILQTMEIKAPLDPKESIELITSRIKITDEEIASVSDDLASSAIETVDYFSSHYREDFRQLVMGWRPTGKKAWEWQKAMKKYEEGK